MKREINQLRAGVVLSYVNLGISTLIPMLYTPVMLRMLGQAEYGVYSLAASAVSYLSLLSFGFGSTIIRYIAKYRAEDNKKEEERTFGFFILLYSILSIVVLIVGFIISNNVDVIFEKGLVEQEIIKMKKLVIIMTFNSALSFPLSVFSSIINAHERYVFKKSVDMLATVGGPVANLIALYLGYASVGMALAATLMQFIMLPLNIRYCVKVLKLKPRFERLSKMIIKEMLGFSVYIFIGTIVDMLFWSTDKVILGMLASSSAVAIYNVGGTFNNMVMNLSTSISGVLAPKITGMAVKDASKEQWTELFVKIGRIQFIVIALVVAGFSVFGKDFIILWAGKEYERAYWVAVLTMFPLCIPLIQNTGLNIVIALNKHKFRSLVYLIIAVVNVISTYYIVPYKGVIGAAVCSCISYLVGQGIIMNAYYYRIIGIDIFLFWKNIFKMGVVPLFMIIGGVILKRYIPIANWYIFLAGVITFTGIYCVLMYFLSMNGYEKELIVKPITRICSRIVKFK